MRDGICLTRQLPMFASEYPLLINLCFALSIEHIVIIIISIIIRGLVRLGLFFAWL